MIKQTFFFILLAFTGLTGYSQDTLKTENTKDTVKTKRLKVLPVPAFGYSPETRINGGAVALFTFNLGKDSLTRTSNAKIKFTYTQNKQIVLESEWTCFLKEEKWVTKGEIHYSKYPDLYYGIGYNTPDTNKLRFSSNRINFMSNLLKNVGDKLFAGVILKYYDYRDLSFASPLPAYYELKKTATTGIGLALLKDKRDNILTPTQNYYFNFNGIYNFSTINYIKFTIDARHYKTWKDKYTLASRFFQEVTLGTPAFYDYAFLGGDKYVRGYYYGRYRDNNFSSIQTELRAHIIWRIGLTAFGGLSDIYHNAQDFNIYHTKYNYGFGFRFLVDKSEHTNLRMDYAIGHDGNTGFYVSFGESF